VTLSAAVGLGVQLWAQQVTTTQTQPAAATQTRGTKVAVMNLAKVINNYNKWTAFKEEYKAEYKKVFEDKVAPLKSNYESLKKEFETATTPPDRKEAISKQMKALERQIQDLADEAKNILGKKESDQFVQLYREVRAAVEAIARYYSIEVVMHYNDAFDEKDMDTPQNVARKMGHAGCMPLYVDKNSDISGIVIDYLNKYYKPAAPITPAGGAAPATTTPTTGQQ
jgi:Skp family chaperone for outer membrane proteins